MTNKFLSILFCLLSMTAACAAAHGRGLEVRPADMELYQVQPREIVTTKFRVTNTSENAFEIVSEVDLPSGWVLASEKFPFDLAANENRTEMISFFVPEGTTAGVYQVRYVARGRIQPSLSDFADIRVEVLPHTEIEVRPLPGPEFVTAGESYESKFSVRNRGNLESEVVVKADSPQLS